MPYLRKKIKIKFTAHIYPTPLKTSGYHLPYDPSRGDLRHPVIFSYFFVYLYLIFF